VKVYIFRVMIVCGLFEWKGICGDFFHRLFIKRGGVGYHLPV
jgi:hypothetical protein